VVGETWVSLQKKLNIFLLNIILFDDIIITITLYFLVFILETITLKQKKLIKMSAIDKILKKTIFELCACNRFFKVYECLGNRVYNYITAAIYTHKKLASLFQPNIAVETIVGFN
jgi:hypothetical protein